MTGWVNGAKQEETRLRRLDKLMAACESGRRLHGMKKYTFADYGFQFITVTAGVLIALFIDGLAETRSNRELVESARATIMRELADNKKDLEATLSGIAADQEAMKNAIRFADELLAARKTKINSVRVALQRCRPGV